MHFIYDAHHLFIKGAYLYHRQCKISISIRPTKYLLLKAILCEEISHFLVPRSFVLLETGARSASPFSCTRPAATLAQ